jgi:hypothetical protein
VAARQFRLCRSSALFGIDTNDPQKKLAALERELERVRHQAEKEEAALRALDDQRREREGRIALARRAHQDLERRLEETRVEQQLAEAQAAIEAFERSLDERNTAADRFAATARDVVARLREYEAAGEVVRNAWQAVPTGPGGRKAIESERAGELTHEPTVVADSLELLAEAVRDRLGGELERDLVEAAARSPMGHDIQFLPAHLQALARERRLAIHRERTRPGH